MPLPQGYPTWWGVVLARDCACVALFLCVGCRGMLTSRAAKFDERGPQSCPRACGLGYVGILRSRKNSGSHVDASHSRHPCRHVQTCTHRHTNTFSRTRARCLLVCWSDESISRSKKSGAGRSLDARAQALTRLAYNDLLCASVFVGVLLFVCVCAGARVVAFVDLGD